MGKWLLMGVASAAIFGAQPASATLQLAIDVAGTNFFCADNTACDSNPAVGVLAIGDQTINGVVVNGSIQESLHGALAALNTSSLSITNGDATVEPVSVAVSDTDYFTTHSSVVVGIAGSGTWLSALGSTATLSWWVDPTNTQGANTSTDTPGTEVGSFTNTPVLVVDSFSDTAKLSFDTPSPFSMTLAASGVLSPGASLISRGQDIAAVNTPEPSTWAMLGIGFGLMTLIGVRKTRRDRLISAL